MKHLNKLVLVLLVLFLSACNENTDTPVIKKHANLEGEWKGHLLSDDLEDESDVKESAINGTYALYITQNVNELKTTLEVTQKGNNPLTVNLSGTIENDSIFQLKSENISVLGFIESESELQLSVKGIESLEQIVLMARQDLPVQGIKSNDYFLEKKIGKNGKGRSIILVHGMNDDVSSWNKLIAYLKEKKIGAKYNVWVFEYEWSKHIKINGGKMKSLINDEINAKHINNNPIIIAHSMGGLVSRSYIAQGGSCYRLVTLGTPHLGSALSNLVPFGKTSGVGDLKPGSLFLTELNNNTEEKAQRSKYWLLNGKSGSYKYCKWHFMGECRMHGRKWHSPKPPFLARVLHAALEKPNDCYVSVSSARFKYAEDVHRVPTFEWIHHIDMNKHDRIKKWLYDFIKKHP